MGLIEGILQPLYGGYPTWLMPHATFLQRPARWLQAISTLGITVSGGPNFAFDLCVRRVRDAEIVDLDLSAWEVAYCGAEPVRAQTMEEFEQRFGKYGFRRSALRPVYGLAEATLLVAAPARHATGPNIVYARADRLEQGQFVPAPDDCASRVALVSCGEPVPGTEVAIVDAATEHLAGAGAIGEIWVCGPSVADGYRAEDVSDGTQFTTREFDGVGRRWLRTGDLGFIVAGELIVSGRIKDLIIVRGRKLHPQDLEQVVQGCDERILPNAVAAFALEGAPAEQVALCIEISPRVLRAESEVRARNLEALADCIRASVFRQHDVAVATVAFVPPGALPRTTSGKLMRFRCRRDFMGGNIDVLRRFDTPALASDPSSRAL
jgi:acyl-CoA synthetase (AMP-forming)/AMP-acid ligase II